MACHGRTGSLARSDFGNDRRVELKFAVGKFFGAYFVEFFNGFDNLINVSMFCRTFGRMGNESDSRRDTGNRSCAFGRRLSNICKFFACRILIQTRIGIDITSVLAILVAALGRNHEEVSGNDGRSLSRFNYLKPRAKSVGRGMACARNHTVYVARFKHERAVHRIVFGERFSRKLYSHSLCLAKFG